MKSVEVKDFAPIVEECFILDKELFDQWHVEAPNSPEVCIARTIEDLKKAHNSPKFYKVMLQKKLIGFYSTEEVGGKLYINTVFIKPKYRNKDISKKFLNLIDKPFYTYLYSKNERAINWYLKNGGIKKMDFIYESKPAVEIEVR